MSDSNSSPVLDSPKPLSTAVRGAEPTFNIASLPPLSLYVHLPWCVKKCPYCDFNSYAARGNIPEQDYVHALLNDVEHKLPELHGRPIETLFIGGGTPSLFSPGALDRLLNGLRSRLYWKQDIEITLEANPGTAEHARFKEFRSIGINRLSIGVQSFCDDLLRCLGRIHDGRDAVRAVEMAHSAGFDNLNIDLMYGLPTQDLGASLTDLRIAIELAPTHISFYQLTIEPNTLFHARRPSLPDDDLSWDMHRRGQQILMDHGYNHYEVSAFAKRSWQCQHNLNYWTFGDYLGIGAGAHGKLTSLSNQSINRYENFKQPLHYMTMAKLGKFHSHERPLKPADALFECLLNVLRLREGVSASLVTERIGLSLEDLAKTLIPAVNDGLLLANEKWIQPTALGQRFLNDLTARFLPEVAETKP